MGNRGSSMNTGTQLARTDNERLAVIEDRVDMIYKNLFGADGEQGKLGAYNHRITKLENWRFYMLGTIAVSSAIFGSQAKEILSKIFGK